MSPMAEVAVGGLGGQQIAWGADGPCGGQGGAQA